MKSHNENNKKKISWVPHPLIFLWVFALVILISFSFMAFFYVENRAKSVIEDFETTDTLTTQRILLQRGFYYAYFLVIDKEFKGQTKSRQDLAEIITQIESNHQWIKDHIVHRISKDPSKATLANLYSGLPYHIEGQIGDYLAHTKVFLTASEEQLNSTNPDFQFINNQIESGALVKNMSELIRESQRQMRQDFRNLRAQGMWMLVYNLVILLGINLFIIFPMFRRIQNQINKINAVNKSLADRSQELKGSQLAVLSMMEDATAARQQAEKARDAAIKLAAIVESSSEAIIGKNLDGIITSWNKGAEKLYGYKAEEVIGQSMKILVPNGREQEMIDISERIKHGHPISNYETVRWKKNGELIDISLTISPIKDAAGHLVGASSIAHDITEIKQARYALEKREEWLRALIENSTDILMLLDIDGKIMYESPSIKRILGYDYVERIGKSVFDFIHQEDVIEIGNLFKNLLIKEKQIISAECRLLHKNGSWRWLEGTGCNLLKEPHIKAVVVNCRDITDRKMALEALKQEKERAQRYLDIAEVMMLVLNGQGELTLINKKGLKILGYSHESEVLGKNLFDDFIPKQNRADAKNVFDRLMMGQMESAEYYESVIMTRDGTRKVIAWHNNFILDENGQRIGTISSGEDVTQRKKDEEKLRQYTQDLQVSNKELEQFAFVASHDLQEPLRIVSSYVQLLAKKYEGNLDAAMEKYINYVVSNTDRMQKMIEGLLAYSRISKREQFLQQIDAGEICDRAISNLRYSIARCGAKVTRDALPVIWAIDTELIQLFQNLIGNAIKYCDKEHPVVHISASKNGKEWTFSIKDNGIGIESQYAHRIFELFKRLHTKQEYPGTGLGLSICKKIVEKNGGRIWVESVPKEGSVFYFTMPQQREVAYEYKTH